MSRKHAFGGKDGESPGLECCVCRGAAGSVGDGPADWSGPATRIIMSASLAHCLILSGRDPACLDSGRPRQGRRRPARGMGILGVAV